MTNNIFPPFVDVSSLSFRLKSHPVTRWTRGISSQRHSPLLLSPGTDLNNFIVITERVISHSMTATAWKSEKLVAWSLSLPASSAISQKTSCQAFGVVSK